MLETIKKHNIHIYIGIMLLAAGFFFAPASTLTVKAQGGACGQRCGQSYGTCGAAPAGYSIRCQVQWPSTTNGSCVCTQIQAPNDTTVPSKTPDSNTVPQPSGTQPSKTPPPLTAECVNRCDLNKDGVITKDDFRTTNPDQATIQFCSSSCPWADGSFPDSGTTSPAPSPITGLLGDCSGSQPGVPDGAVDLKDIEYYRQELNNEVSTNACDFDQSGDVDIIDFTNYLRPGYIKFNQDGTQTPGDGNGEGPTPVPAQDPADGTVTPVPTSSTGQPLPTPSTNAGTVTPAPVIKP